MPHVPAGTETRRSDLSGCLMEYDVVAERNYYIGHRVFRRAPVYVQAGPFARIPIKELLKDPETARAPGSKYNRDDYKTEMDAFATFEHGLEGVVDQRFSAMYKNLFNQELRTAQRKYTQVTRAAEKRAAAKLFNTTTYTGAALTTVISTDWTTHATATPCNDIEAAITKVWEGSGLYPNAVVLSRNLFRNLRQCQQVLDKITSNGAGESIKAAKVSIQQIAEVLDIPNVLVAGAPKAGSSTTVQSVWNDDYCWVGRIAETEDHEEPCIGRAFYFTDENAEDGLPIVESYYDPSTRSDIVRVRHDEDLKMFGAQFGHLLTGCAS